MLSMRIGVQTSATPRVIPPGSRVALIAPAGPLAHGDELRCAMENVRQLGWDAVVGRSALRRDGYFAGNDAARLADLMWALEDSLIDAIWCLRGGYGAMRLLSAIDVNVVRDAQTGLIGFSDITALHALWQRAGVTSFHGPTARGLLSEYSRNALMQTVQRGTREVLHAPDAVPIRGGVATGRLVAGNLALVAALCGTPWQLDFRDAIVVLEDVGEAMYRLDRMLTQLRLAGAFAGCRAVVFGQFTNCPEGTDDGARTLDSLITETADVLGVPVLANVPVGHIPDQWTLPLGDMVTLDVDARSLTIDPHSHATERVSS